MHIASKTLVTGASGALGRLICRNLIAARPRNLVFASRTPDKLADFAVEADIRHVDFDIPTTLDAAFSGATRALIISTDALLIPGQRRRQQKAALSAALRAAVDYVAYTSMPNPARSAEIPFAPDHAAMEADLKSSGVAYSSLRNSWYQENLLAYLPQIIRNGTWFTAAGQGRIAYVARADAARGATRILTGERAIGEIDIAGPDSMTVDEIAALVNKTLGCSIRVEHVKSSELPQRLERQGITSSVIPMVAVTEANQRAGNFDVSGEPLAELLGQPTRSLADFLQDHSQQLLSAFAH
jgi:NAD(P)H dehydrogenase (quinone)